jgi:preprotein translocase subunit SecD
MAVDANVLIFECIREELRRGLSGMAAVQEGFGRATLTILDANVTTLIAAVILYQFGTGPIRGFAVTLTLGILASMFTAIFVSRIMFDLWLAKRKPGAQLNI